MSFINKFSFKCLLGPRSTDVEIVGNLATWTVGKKKHFTNLSELDSNDLIFLQGYGPSNFHYLTQFNLDQIKTIAKVTKTKLNSTCIPLTNLEYKGRAFHGIRGAINKNKKLNLAIETNYRKIEDVKIMLEDWSNNYTTNYFRDFSGKNMFFYKNNYHINCLNTFIYDADQLIAFATLSPGLESSYIIGKALFKKYPGLSEYADDCAYRLAIDNGVGMVNLGQSKGGIATYKNKFPNAYSEIHYDGNI